jgi:pimeloyl-ACP methyl ester carboxylesterase
MSALPEGAGVEHRWVDAGGLRVHLAEAGAGEPLVMLHGWPQHWYMWRKVIPRLAESYRVICPDLRGFGWTDATPGGYVKEELTDDVLRLLDALELDRVRLVGHDWGGWIGFLLCLRAPRRFERFLALNILHPWIGGLPAVIPYAWRFSYQLVVMAPLLGYQLHRRSGFIPGILRNGSTVKDAWDEETVRAFADNLAEPDRARAGVQMYRSFQLREVPGLLRGRYADERLTVPTLLLFGTGDAVLRPELLDGYERHADAMEVELVPDCGHFIADERPGLVAERARAFFG